MSKHNDFKQFNEENEDDPWTAYYELQEDKKTHKPVNWLNVAITLLLSTGLLFG